MVSARPLRNVDIYTPAGRLEGLYRDVESPDAVAIIAHPHPLHGGTMHNKVVFRAARGLENANVATLRFNFRGAGASQGQHDFGDGEQRDVESALDWLRKKHPGKLVLVGGFSFGAWVVSRIACEQPDVAAMFLLGTPVNKYDFSHLRDCGKPILFIHGDEDEFGDVEKLDALAQKCRDAEVIVVTGADHFFTNQLEVVEETLRDWTARIIEEKTAAK